MKPGTYSLLILSFFCGKFSFASDTFSTIQCGSEISKKLIGRHVKNEKVVAIEARHKSLGLKNLGMDDISEGLLAGYWMICGNKFILLEDKKFLIHDVLQVPDDSKNLVEFTGKCTIHNKEKSELIFALLNKEDGVASLSANSAWIVDEKKKLFKKTSTDGMRCENFSSAPPP
ncbi:hypothetical protein F2P45_22890 [Massilia sp. CCM 8733]|uniref:Uncharacterized protein n=1 Tax=Massilia mucilaginosa TaxID=2609282 RepID=A0ABX0NYI3_9BURK|nr:hypothetical protein [Massilia mucilaginosa]NHZ91829.1 hypothetical protein [Massilia mucilaginosa]